MRTKEKKYLLQISQHSQLFVEWLAVLQIRFHLLHRDFPDSPIHLFFWKGEEGNLSLCTSYYLLLLLLSFFLTGLWLTISFLQLLLTNCMILDYTLELSEPWLHYLWNRCKKTQSWQYCGIWIWIATPSKKRQQKV